MCGIVCGMPSNRARPGRKPPRPDLNRNRNRNRPTAGRTRAPVCVDQWPRCLRSRLLRSAMNFPRFGLASMLPKTE